MNKQNYVIFSRGKSYSESITGGVIKMIELPSDMLQLLNIFFGTLIPVTIILFKMLFAIVVLPIKALLVLILSLFGFVRKTTPEEDAGFERRIKEEFGED